MGIKLYFEENGSGFPLILLHGNGENCGYFANQIGVFSQEYHVYALDTRGHGKSPRGDGPFSISRFADDLADFMDQREIPKAHILGFSDGGNIALVFAIRYPERVCRLILNGANLDFNGLEDNVKEWIENAYNSAEKRYEDDPSALAEVEMIGLMINDPDIPASDLEKVTAPTLVIAGTRDMIRRDHSELIASGIKDSRLVFIEGDHYIARDASGDFNAAVLDFLTGKD